MKTSKNKATELKKVIRMLHIRFKKLEEGITYNTNINNSKPIHISVHVNWEEGDKGNYNYDINKIMQDNLNNILYKVVNDSCKKFNIKIAKLLDDSDRYAKKFGVEEHKFFETVMRG